MYCRAVGVRRADVGLGSVTLDTVILLGDLSLILYFDERGLAKQNVIQRGKLSGGTASTAN